MQWSSAKQRFSMFMQLQNIIQSATAAWLPGNNGSHKYAFNPQILT